MSPEETQLLAEIQRAFRDVRRDGGIGWREAEQIDNHGNGEEMNSARAQDAEEFDWQRIDSVLFDSLPSAAGFLDFAGVRFYLPAIMVADLHRSGEWKSAVIDSFLGHLENAELYESLSDSQRACVAEWLQVQHKRHPWFAPKAIAVYGSAS